VKLRPYQRDAIDATWNFLRYRKGNPCIVMPTGSGKSPTLADMIRTALTDYPGTRVCVLAHVAELVSQNADKLRALWPDAPRDAIGIYSAGLGKRDRFAPALFASIQSVAKKAKTLGRFDFVIVDECHRIPLRSEGLYRQFLADCDAMNPGMPVIGLTATPYRLGGGPVVGPDYILNAVSYEAKVGDLVRQGYLARPISKAGLARADMSDVHVRNGEYVQSEVERASNVPALVSQACDEIVNLCADRRAWIIFAAGCDHARAVTAALKLRGIECGLVVDDTPAGERGRMVDDFKQGRLRAIVNVRVFTEGFDAPNVDAVVMMAPTKSAGLYYQEVGRGFRPIFAPGYDIETDEGRLAAQAAGPKRDFLVLDFAGNILEHGPVDAIVPPKKPGQKATSAAPVRECPKCQAHVPASSRTCECGYEFPAPDRGFNHDTTASDAAILSDEGSPVTSVRHEVTNVTYARHEKPGKPPSLRVIYQCGLRQFSEWVCIEHGGIPRARAMTWWMARDADGLTPKNVDAAIEASKRLREPGAIFVNDRTKYPEIVSYDFESQPARTRGDGKGTDARAEHREGPAGVDALYGLPLVRAERELRPMEGQGSPGGA
jgi:DNA repair protein RadD